MIYRVLDPTLENPDAAYPMIVAAVVPAGLRGLVIAAILSAIMSTVAGLVNSTSTSSPWTCAARPGTRLAGGQTAPRGPLVRCAGTARRRRVRSLVMRWENIFRYARTSGRPWRRQSSSSFSPPPLDASHRTRRLACLWLSILSVPLVLTKAILADANLHFLPANLENPMVLAGAVALISVVWMISLSQPGSPHPIAVADPSSSRRRQSALTRIAYRWRELLALLATAAILCWCRHPTASSCCCSAPAWRWSSH